jgi:hypothetical protein
MAEDRIDRLKRDIELLRSEIAGAIREKDLSLFDEFVREQEYELALHLVCDFLLGADAIPVTEAVLKRIEELHRTMDIRDDCTARLVLKSNPC